MIEQGKLLELDHNKIYIVASTAILDGKKYLYLVGHEDQSDVMFAIEEQTETGVNVIELGEDEDITEIAKALYDQGAGVLDSLPKEGEAE